MPRKAILVGGPLDGREVEVPEWSEWTVTPVPLEEPEPEPGTASYVNTHERDEQGRMIFRHDAA